MRNSAIIRLLPHVKFPDLRNRIDSGLIAYGGELGINRLLEAYSKGIFPWYDYDSPVLWHSPLERCIFGINDLKISHSLRNKLNRKLFTFTFDQHFTQIMQHCALIDRKEGPGTWIFSETIQAYTQLHKEGYAHSVEVWHEGVLAGGIFGVSLGKAFFGESMFHIVTDASKVGMKFLFDFLKTNDFHFVDAQMETNHLMSLGARIVSRNNYLDMLEEALKHQTLQGNWNEYIKRSGKTPPFYGRGHKDGSVESER